MPRLSNTSHAVLGLLSFARLSGYDVVQTATHSIAHFWPISKTHVYAELRRLEEEGLVRGTAVEQRTAPDKTVYELTPAGEDALDGWLLGGAPEQFRLRASGLLKLLLGHRTDPARTVALLERFEHGALARRDELSRLAGDLERNPDAVYAWATTLFGVRVAEAVAAWAGEVAPRIARGRVRLDPRRRDPAKTLEHMQVIRRTGSGQ